MPVFTCIGTLMKLIISTEIRHDPSYRFADEWKTQGFLSFFEGNFPTIKKFEKIYFDACNSLYLLKTN